MPRRSARKLPKPRFDVVTIGAATRDVFVKSSHFDRIPSDSAPDGWNACLPMGSKIAIDQLVFETGGGATNAAITFSRFGLKTACVSRVGKDVGGSEIRERLKKDHVDVSEIQTDADEPTGYSIILLAGTGHRAILVSRGASKHIVRSQIAWKKLSSKWIYLTSVAGDRKLLSDVFAQAKKNLTHVAWNPGGSEIELGKKALLTHLLQTDVLLLNLEEAAELAETSPRRFDKILSTLGPLPRQALVITDGARGAFAYSRGVTWHVSSPKGKVINTTGAGDAFGSAFVASLSQDGDLARALKAGALNAHGVVTHMGAKVGILKKFPAARELAKLTVREYRHHVHR
ncbi:carbohydrate kinase family protein [Patescibacteria group bacterium]|nr:carbohydrate kinase family protein [Patescibacteria group bacterium]